MSRKTVQEKVRGFTLVEILVGVGIVALLAAVTLVSVGKAREKGNLTRAKAEIDQIATGAYLYYQDTGTWAPDVVTGINALFYNSKYIPITGTAEPLSFLGPNYTWDWQNWGTDWAFNPPPNNFMCWQSVDLYRYDPSFGSHLVIRKCIRDVCTNQKYCDENGDCYNSAKDRDTSTNPIAPPFYRDIPASAVCENCSSEVECARKFQPY